MMMMMMNQSVTDESRLSGSRQQPGKSTPGKSLLPWRQVNVLAIYTESNQSWLSPWVGWYFGGASGLYATAVGWESVYSWCDPVTWPQHWIAFTVKPFFQVLRSLLVLSTASSTGGKVFRSSQSALCTNFRLQWGRYRVNYPQSSS